MSAVNTECPYFFQDSDFFTSDKCPELELLGLYSSSVFNFLSSLILLLHGSCTNFIPISSAHVTFPPHPHQQFSPHLFSWWSIIRYMICFWSESKWLSDVQLTVTLRCAVHKFSGQRTWEWHGLLPGSCQQRTPEPQVSAFLQSRFFKQLENHQETFIIL